MLFLFSLMRINFPIITFIYRRNSVFIYGSNVKSCSNLDPHQAFTTYVFITYPVFRFMHEASPRGDKGLVQMFKQGMHVYPMILYFPYLCEGLPHAGQYRSGLQVKYYVLYILSIRDLSIMVILPEIPIFLQISFFYFSFSKFPIFFVFF